MNVHPEAMEFTVDLVSRNGDGEYVAIDHALCVNEFRDLDVHIKLSANGFVHYVRWNVMFNSRNFVKLPV